MVFLKEFIKKVDFEKKTADNKIDAKCPSWVKLGKFGLPAKFRQRPWLFHILIIGIKNKLTKQTVKIIRSRLI